MEKDASTRYSPSKLDTYRNCPRQYQYRYIDAIPRKGKSVEAYLGSCVHKALEKLYEGVRHGKISSESEVLDAYGRAWREDLGSVVLRKPEYSLDDWRAVGLDCVRTYYGRFRPFDQDKTVGIEMRVGFPLQVADPEAGAAETVRIEGFIDRLALAPDGAFDIHDYKTGKSLPTQADRDEDWQLAVYNIGVLQAWPDAVNGPPVRLKWHYLRHGRTIVSTRAPEALQALREDIAGLVLAIKRDRAFEPRKSPLCDWCDYRDICPIWKHAEAVARLPEEERRRETGVRLADGYAELDRRKKALRAELRAVEAEQEELDRRVLEYADARGASALDGGACRLEIHSKEEFKFPARTQAPEELDVIESELKKTPIWPEVSRLDSRALMDGFTSRRWPREILRTIEGWMGRLIRRETVRTVRVHQKKDSAEE